MYVEIDRWCTEYVYVDVCGCAEDDGMYVCIFVRKYCAMGCKMYHTYIGSYKMYIHWSGLVHICTVPAKL